MRKLMKVKTLQDSQRTSEEYDDLNTPNDQQMRAVIINDKFFEWFLKQTKKHNARKNIFQLYFNVIYRMLPYQKITLHF